MHLATKPTTEATAAGAGVSVRRREGRFKRRIEGLTRRSEALVQPAAAFCVQKEFFSFAGASSLKGLSPTHGRRRGRGEALLPSVLRNSTPERRRSRRLFAARPCPTTARRETLPPGPPQPPRGRSAAAKGGRLALRRKSRRAPRALRPSNKAARGRRRRREAFGRRSAPNTRLARGRTLPSASARPPLGRTAAMGKGRRLLHTVVAARVVGVVGREVVIWVVVIWVVAGRKTPLGGCERRRSHSGA